MQISFSPMRRDDRLTLVRQGTALIINGLCYDFGTLPDGATLPRAAVACDWLLSDVERIGGILHLTLILPHGADAPAAALDPKPLSVRIDGPIDLPPFQQSEV